MKYHQLIQQQIQQIKAAVHSDDPFTAGKIYRTAEVIRQRINRLQDNLNLIQRLSLEAYISLTERDDLKSQTERALVDAQIAQAEIHLRDAGKIRETNFNPRVEKLDA